MSEDICPTCNTPLAEGATQCAICGWTSLDDEDWMAEISELESKLSTIDMDRACDMCGSKMEVGATECAICGFKEDVAEPEADKASGELSETDKAVGTQVEEHVEEQPLELEGVEDLTDAHRASSSRGHKVESETEGEVLDDLFEAFEDMGDDFEGGFEDEPQSLDEDAHKVKTSGKLDGLFEAFDDDEVEDKIEEEPVAAAAPPEPSIPKGMFPCPECSTHITMEMESCPTCGVIFVDDEDELTEAETAEDVFVPTEEEDFDGPGMEEDPAGYEMEEEPAGPEIAEEVSVSEAGGELTPFEIEETLSEVEAKEEEAPKVSAKKDGSTPKSSAKMVEDLPRRPVKKAEAKPAQHIGRAKIQASTLTTEAKDKMDSKQDHIALDTPVSKKAPLPVASARPKPVAKAALKPIGKPALKPISKSAGKPALKPIGKPTLKPFDKAGKPTLKPIGKPGKPTLKPIGKADKLTIKPVGKSTDRSEAPVFTREKGFVKVPDTTFFKPMGIILLAVGAILDILPLMNAIHPGIGIMMFIIGAAFIVCGLNLIQISFIPWGRRIPLPRKQTVKRARTGQ